MATLASVTNNQDGKTVTVVLSSASGAVTFYASRTAGQQGAALPAGSVVQTGALTYVLTVADGALASVEVPWMIQADDSAGLSAALPVWVCYGTDDTFPVQAARALQQILIAHKPLLDLRLQALAPRGQTLAVQQILAANAESITRTPALYITPVRLPETLFGMPLTNMITPSLHVFAVHFHTGPTSQRDMMSALGWAVRSILNQSQFMDLTLPSGVTLTKCGVRSLETNEVYHDEQKRYEVVTELEWAAEQSIPLP